jgi:thiol-disulfide isomerase/thioredoxin
MKVKCLFVLATALLAASTTLATDDPGERAYQDAIAAIRGKEVDPIKTMDLMLAAAVGHPEHPKAGRLLHGYDRADNDATPQQQAAYSRAFKERFTALLARPDLPQKQRAAFEEQVERRRRVEGWRSEPLQLRFTALDGREVDMSRLRGKVVLLEFWATWCGPCVADIPKLKEIYAKYHDRGFEIVGITLEDARVIDEAARKLPRNAGKALDTIESAAAKIEASRQKLAAYVAERELPWPQFFDGRGFEGDISRRFQVGAIPKALLFDQSGRMVDMDARGDRLENKLQALLGDAPPAT